MALPDKPLRVLVVDDSALYRKIVRDVLGAVPGVEVVGTASNGVLGLSQIDALKPDVVTLDFEMPQLDGIGLLKRLAGKPNAPAVIMISAFTAAGAKATTTALQEGAFDFILKPATQSLQQSVEQLRRDLVPKLQACRLRTVGQRANRVAAKTAPRRAAAPTPPPPSRAPIKRKPLLQQKPEIVGIAISTGGPKTLTKLLPQLPGDFPCPIVLVQHMPPMFTASLASDLDGRCALQVVEGSHGMPVERGRVIIAPGGKQMRVAMNSDRPTIEITNDPPERNCKPAADYLFRSIAEAYGGRTLGVVLTGMGDDGTLGCRAIKEAGGTVLAQDEATCVVYGMPKAVADAGLTDVVAPLNTIATKITNLAHRRACR